MDEIAEYNRARWNALVEAGIEWSRPFLSLTVESSRALVDEAGFLGDLTGKQVLCLGGGGGQQRGDAMARVLAGDGREGLGRGLIEGVAHCAVGVDVDEHGFALSVGVGSAMAAAGER